MKETNLPRPTPAEYALRMQYIYEDEYDKEMEMRQSYNWNVILFEENEFFGLKNTLGEILLPARFENFMGVVDVEYVKGEWVVARLNGKWGIIIADGTGTWQMPPQFDYVGFPNTVTHVRKDGKWGIVNVQSGEFIIPLECEEVSDDNGFFCTNGVGFYRLNGRYGLINEKHHFTAPIFDRVDIEPEGPARVMYKGEWGFVNENDVFTTEEEEAAWWTSADC